MSPPLQHGDYSLVVEAPGFSKVRRGTSGWKSVGSVPRNADIVWPSATMLETIEVQATGQLLDTESSNVGNLRTEKLSRICL